MKTKINTKQAIETYRFKMTIFASFDAMFHHVFLLYQGSGRCPQLAINEFCNSVAFGNSLLLIGWLHGGLILPSRILIPLTPRPPLVIVLLIFSALAQQTNLIFGRSPMCKGLFQFLHHEGKKADQIKTAQKSKDTASATSERPYLSVKYVRF